MDWIDQARGERELAYEPKYGPIRPKTDKRCFRREALEELLDALNYYEWGFEKGELSRKQRQWLDSGTKRMIRILEFACRDKFEWETELFARN